MGQVVNFSALLKPPRQPIEHDTVVSQLIHPSEFLDLAGITGARSLPVCLGELVALRDDFSKGETEFVMADDVISPVVGDVLCPDDLAMIAGRSAIKPTSASPAATASLTRGPDANSVHV